MEQSNVNMMIASSSAHHYSYYNSFTPHRCSCEPRSGFPWTLNATSTSPSPFAFVLWSAHSSFFISKKEEFYAVKSVGT
ncbi:hypothetical protein TIFTF001_025438 [Ficus carica]|uniref:Uncharacterized protein n=1 Tax=Ficus carica TaxID=3494 RepID=A0AA88B1D9_FICCA|nr:hypothetical protein TIFTF001_025438 [Ficus carica]